MRDEDPVRIGLTVSAISLAWTVVSGIAATGIGIARGSLVLVAFGATSALDAVGSVALVLHSRHALHHDIVSESRERIAVAKARNTAVVEHDKHDRDGAKPVDIGAIRTEHRVVHCR